MKTIIKYIFDDEDVYKDNAIRRLNNSTCSYLALFEIREHLQSLLKQECSYEVYESIVKIQTEFLDILDSNHIDLDDLE